MHIFSVKNFWFGFFGVIVFLEFSQWNSSWVYWTEAVFFLLLIGAGAVLAKQTRNFLMWALPAVLFLGWLAVRVGFVHLRSGGLFTI